MSNPSTPPRGPFDVPPYLGQRRQRGLLGWVVLVLAACLIGGLIWWVVANKAKDTADQGGGFGPPGVGGPPGAAGQSRRGKGGAVVNAAKTDKGDMPVVVSALGTVTPSATVTVKSQISGQLMSVAFQEGQMVTKGQLLAQIDPRPYEQALAQADATLAKDEAQLANARADLKRYQTLLAQDSVSRQQVDTQAALVRQLEAQTKADRAASGAQKLNITYTRVTAPVAGRVGLRQIDPGNYVTPGDSNGLVTVATFAPIDVAFSLPEDVLPKIVSARSKGVKPKVEVLDRAQTQVLARGELTSLDNLIDTTTGTIRAKARFANVDGALFPNQFVNVRLTTEVLRSVVIAPTSAILRGQQGLFVYVIDAAHKVHIRTVQPGPAQGERTAILSGLSVGDLVVTDGTDRLREGMTVTVPPPCAPSGAGGGGRRSGAPGGGGSGKAWSGSGSGSAGCRPAAAAGSGPVAAGTGADQPSGQGRRPDASAGAGPAGAAGSAGEASGAPSGGSGRMQALLAELNLDPAQQAKADAILSEARDKAQAALGDDADPDARRAAMRKAMGEALGRLAPVLRPDQKAKLADLRAKMAAGGGQKGGDQGGGSRP